MWIRGLKAHTFTLTVEGFLRKPREDTSQSVHQTVIDGNQEGRTAISLLPEKKKTTKDYTGPSSPHHRLDLDSDTPEPELLALHFSVLALSSSHVGVYEEEGRVVESASVALILPRSTRDPLTVVLYQ